MTDMTDVTKSTIWTPCTHPNAGECRWYTGLTWKVQGAAYVEPHSIPLCEFCKWLDRATDMFVVAIY